MTLIIQSEAYIIGIEKALDDSERTVGSIIEPQKDGALRVVATFNEAVASVIEQLDNKVRAAEQRVKEMEAKQQHISLKPHVYRELVNQLRDTAVKYSGCQQLREQISETLSTFIIPAHSHSFNSEKNDVYTYGYRPKTSVEKYGFPPKKP